jgi:hypothetical protein
MLTGRIGVPALGFLLVVTFAQPIAHSQSTAAGTASAGQHLIVGAAGSSFNADWSHFRVTGETMWVDYAPGRLPLGLRGLGIEVEARDLNSETSSLVSRNFRLYTVGGGIIWHWRHFQSVHPYAKYLVSIGSIDWKNPNPRFRHETRSVTAPGFGMELRVVRRVWVRGDYEYQFWPDIAKFRPHSSHVLDPQGFSFGVCYALVGDGRVGR